MDARAYPLHGSLHRTYLEHDWLTIDGPALRHPGELAPRLVLQKGAEPCAAVAGLPAVADIHAKALHRSLLARPASCTPSGYRAHPGGLLSGIAACRRNSPADSGMWSDRQSRHRPHPSSTQEVGYIRPIVTVATATATGWIDILISSWPMSKRSSATDIASPPSVTTAVT